MQLRGHCLSPLSRLIRILSPCATATGVHKKSFLLTATYLIELVMTSRVQFGSHCLWILGKVCPATRLGGTIGEDSTPGLPLNKAVLGDLSGPPVI